MASADETGHDAKEGPTAHRRRGHRMSSQEQKVSRVSECMLAVASTPAWGLGQSARPDDQGTLAPIYVECSIDGGNDDGEAH